jgi:hypothetical protein
VLSGAKWDEHASHALHSPDLAPSRFHLFGRVKQLLAGHKFHDPGALSDAVQAILMDMDKATSHDTFPAWMERLEPCIMANGDKAE